MNNSQKVDKMFKAYQDNVPGAAVMVIRDGRPILTKTYGLANMETGEKITTETNFRLASVTKQFTAMSILMLIEQGELQFDTSLRYLFPDFPVFAESITIQHLLQHTSGLIDYESLIPDSVTVQVLDKDVLQMMIATDSTYFSPGSDYRYSNSGYAVLAMIVEKISGKTFPRFLRKHIFKPLGMNETIAFHYGVNSVNNRAFGYTVSDDSITFSDQSVTSAVLGDGGIYSSLTDLYKWDQVLYTDKLLLNELKEKAFTPHLENYGFGWRIDTFMEKKRVHHTGSTRGFRTVIQRFPDEQLTIIILTNRNGPMVGDMAEEIAKLYL